MPCLRQAGESHGLLGEGILKIRFIIEGRGATENCFQPLPGLFRLRRIAIFFGERAGIAVNLILIIFWGMGYNVSNGKQIPLNVSKGGTPCRVITVL